MQQQVDHVATVDWASVPMSRTIELVKTALAAQHARSVFRLAAYVWMIASLFAVVALRPEDVGWSIVASGVAVVCLSRLGAHARRLNHKESALLRELAADHPSRD